MRVPSAVLAIVVAVGLGACGDPSDRASPAPIDCVDLWRVDGQLRVPWRMAEPLHRDLVGKPVEAVAWDCGTDAERSGHQTLQLRKIEGVPARMALYAPSSDFYRRRVFVPEAWRSDTAPPALLRFLRNG